MRVVVLSSFLMGATDLLANNGGLHYVTSENVPPVNRVINMAMDALPNFLSDLPTYERRIKLARLLPKVTATYGDEEDVYDQYQWLEVRQIKDTDQVVTERKEALAVQTQTKTIRKNNGDIVTTVTDTIPEFPDVDNKENRKDGKLGKSVKYDKSTKMGTDKRFISNYSVKAKWNLSNLFFSNDEIQAGRVSSTLAEFQRNYYKDISDIYRDLYSAMNALPEDTRDLDLSDARLRKKILIRDTQAEILDYLTDGAFLEETLMTSLNENER